MKLHSDLPGKNRGFTIG